VNRDAIDLSHVKHLVLDECFWLLDKVEMKAFVQGIYDKLLHIENKQVLLFTERDDLMTDRMLEVYKGFCRKVRIKLIVS
jgi:superfamily II DNA/RNA helicase